MGNAWIVDFYKEYRKRVNNSVLHSASTCQTVHQCYMMHWLTSDEHLETSTYYCNDTWVIFFENCEHSHVVLLHTDQYYSSKLKQSIVEARLHLRLTKVCTFNHVILRQISELSTSMISSVDGRATNPVKLGLSSEIAQWQLKLSVESRFAWMPENESLDWNSQNENVAYFGGRERSNPSIATFSLLPTDRQINKWEFA